MLKERAKLRLFFDIYKFFSKKTKKSNNFCNFLHHRCHQWSFPTTYGVLQGSPCT